LQGEIPSPIEPPVTCRLYARCPYALPHCLSRPATLVAVEPEHATRCVRFLDEHKDGVWEPLTVNGREVEAAPPLVETGASAES
jgi:hypothetical protein